MRYVPVNHIHALLPGRKEDVAQQAVLVIGSEVISVPLVEIKKQTPSIGELPRQCAWCGLILTGRWQGATALCLVGKASHPYLLPGYSHGLCRSCRKKMCATWQQSRTTKGTTQSLTYDRPSACA